MMTTLAFNELTNVALLFQCYRVFCRIVESTRMTGELTRKRLTVLALTLETC